jgi:hypothetical protein
LIKLYGFPEKGDALVLVDYLNRVPVVGLTGVQPIETRSGDAAIEIREMAKRHNWAVIAAAALKTSSFSKDPETFDLEDLLGDERAVHSRPGLFDVEGDGDC